MKVFVALATLLAVAVAQNYDESPKPYSFNYVAEGEEGSSSHSETADGSGTVRGTYTLTDMDGRNRVVEYIADAEGYRATIRSNEPGTDNAAPADVTMESTAEGAKALFNAAIPKPEARPIANSIASRPAAPATTAGSEGGARYVLVPVEDPRARAYYGRN